MSDDCGLSSRLRRDGYLHRIARRIWLTKVEPIVFICGHYEGIDERVRLALHPEEISLGDYVLTGGELAALVMLDAVSTFGPWRAW